MAFDGPGPFDGDPAFILQAELEEAPEDAEAIIEDALATALEQSYIDVDDGVWAWVAAELIATNIGRPGPDSMPPAFQRVKVSDVSDLASLAVEALAAVADVDRSELAQLWAEGYDDPLSTRLVDLTQRLVGETARGRSGPPDTR